MMNNFTINKCKTKAAYSTKINGRINLDKVKSNYNVIMDSPILIMINIDTVKIIVHKHGEILFKNCNDKTKIKKIAQEIYDNCLE